MICSKTTIHHACVDSAVTLFGNIFTGGTSMGNVSYSVITLFIQLLYQLYQITFLLKFAECGRTRYRQHPCAAAPTDTI